MQMPDGRFLFGRVVRTLTRSDRLALVYVFRYLATGPIAPARLLVSDLLIPPATINRIGWSRGFLSTIDNRPFEAGERLTTHYFRGLDPEPSAGQGRSRIRRALGRFLPQRGIDAAFEDEDGQPLGQPPPGTPIGEAGIGNYRTLDDQVSTALGIPLAPDD